MKILALDSATGEYRPRGFEEPLGEFFLLEQLLAV